MHGVGTFTSPGGGSCYTGGWLRDVKHGLGRRVFANGDCYDGLWREGRPHGPGTYHWDGGNSYDGECAFLFFVVVGWLVGWLVGWVVIMHGVCSAR